MNKSIRVFLIVLSFSMSLFSWQDMTVYGCRLFTLWLPSQSDSFPRNNSVTLMCMWRSFSFLQYGKWSYKMSHIYMMEYLCCILREQSRYVIVLWISEKWVHRIISSLVCVSDVILSSHCSQCLSGALLKLTLTLIPSPDPSLTSIPANTQLTRRKSAGNGKGGSKRANMNKRKQLKVTPCNSLLWQQLNHSKWFVRLTLLKNVMNSQILSKS